MSFTSFPIQTNSFASYAASLTGTLQFGSILQASCFNVNTSIAPSNPETSSSTGLFFFENVAGSVSSGGARYNYINVNSDNAAIPNGIGTAFGINHNFGGTAAKGDRDAFSSQLSIFTTSQNTGASYSSAGIYAQATVNDNGTGTTSGTASGQLQTMNVIGLLETAATNWYQCSAAEFDVSIGTGCSAYEKIGIALVELGTDKVHGATVDTCIAISNQVGAVGWNLGIGFGRPDGIWPFVSTATIMGAELGGVGSATAEVTYGIDFSAITFASGGAPYLAPLITPSSSSATGKQGSICWDSGFIYICTSTNTWKRVALSSF